MAQKYHRGGRPLEKKKRIQNEVWLYFDGWTIEEIAEESGMSVRTIERDIEYIEAHPEKFFN